MPWVRLLIFSSCSTIVSLGAKQNSLFPGTGLPVEVKVKRTVPNSRERSPSVPTTLPAAFIETFLNFSCAAPLHHGRFQTKSTFHPKPTKRNTRFQFVITRWTMANGGCSLPSHHGRHCAPPPAMEVSKINQHIMQQSYVVKTRNNIINNTS